jgi:hypothetical protein
MSIDPRFVEELDTPPAAKASPSPARLWLERAAIGLIAAISLLVPLVIGLLYYLAVTDGLVINANDPLHEVRLWMVQERRGATGLGLTVTTPFNNQETAKNPAIQCANTDVTFLKWDRRLRIERDANYCRCFERHGDQLVDTSAVTCQQ